MATTEESSNTLFCVAGVGKIPWKGATKRAEKHFKRIQRVLGDHQDSVVASGALRQFALTAGTTPGENGFTYGLLYGREQQIAEDARTQARKLLR